jgi:signal transduction histidine kinase
MTLNPALETAAKLQRAKERLYVLCQTGGWGTFFLIQLLSLKIFIPARQQSLSGVELLCAILRVIFIGWLITHYSRPLLTRLGWKELGWRALVPRIALASTIVGVTWCAVGFAIDLLVLRYPWNRDYSIAVGFVGVSMQASLTAIGWFWVYFFYHIFERLQRMQVEQLRLAASVKEAELRALKSQVNPHFLFNSLNSLRALIDEDAPRAREAVTRLANMLRYSLQSGQLEKVSLDEELRTVEDYLALEQIRHEGRLRVRWAVAEATRTQSVPPMLLQTMVENAVKYGISTRREGGEVLVSARLAAGTMCLLVTNPGELAAPGNAASAMAGSSTGVGLRNASERLKLLYGDQATLRLLAEPAGCVTAEVSIPLPPGPA